MFGMSKVASLIAWLMAIGVASWLVMVMLSVEPPLFVAVQTAAQTAAGDIRALAGFITEHPTAVIAWLMIVHYAYVGLRELRQMMRHHLTAGCKWWKALVKPDTITHAALGVLIPVMFVVVFDAKPETTQASVSQMML